MPRHHFFALITLLAASATIAGCAETPPPQPVAPPIPIAITPPARVPEPASPELDAILARYVEARGGAAKLHAVRSLRFTGTVRFDDGDFVLEATYGAE